MTTLNTPVDNFPRIGEKYVKKLAKLGIKTVGDLLFHFPFRYDDFSEIISIDEISIGQVATVYGKISKIKTIRIWKRKMFITEALISDKSSSIRAVWFNQPYIENTMIVGKEVRLSGKVTDGKKGVHFSNPAYELASRTPVNTGRLVPIYPETEGLTSRWLRWQISSILKLNLKLSDPIPEALLKKLKLPELKKAIRKIHFPNNEKDYVLAQKRFAFEEMLLVQLKALQVKISWQRESSVKIKFDKDLVKNFVDDLPFKLTDAQKKSSFQILKDLEKDHPMNRLLNGDVGSGKTVIASIAVLQTMDSGYQAVIMAPTEVLARQHFSNLSELFSDYNFGISLLTNSYKITSRAMKEKTTTRPSLLKKIKSGEISLVIGTHAVIQKDIRFAKLSLIIVDEQHRFGVAQRAYLQQEISKINDGIKNKVPHFLTMTATPIPRTLTLAFFGNLDLSLLDEMPKNRKKVITKIIDPDHRNQTYDFVRHEVRDGRQIFVILPLVEQSKALAEVKAATEEHKRLSEKIFPELKIGLLHGRLKSAEKEKVMNSFQNKKLNILVSTSVVEVGIDIPNATVMIIEDADRFGLSQLHQFRGRVGRSDIQSYCLLFTSSNSSKAKARLKALVASTDGFKIAQKDLQLRGPGEFFGTRQSGIPDIAMENITNVKLIQIAREEAQIILESDPELKKHPLLADALRKFNEKIHLE